MLYFRTQRIGQVLKVLEITDRYDGTRADRAEFTYRGELFTMWDAEKLAEAATRDMGEAYLAVDNGQNVSPRFDVIRAPRVGAPVSMAFNGDYYPCGTIEKIGGSNFKTIYTTDGTKFNRRRQTGTWVRKGGTFCMVAGHRDERNPSF